MRTLFETRDLSAVRNYLARQWTKILAGRVSLQDFVFAKEVSVRFVERPAGHATTHGVILHHRIVMRGTEVPDAVAADQHFAAASAHLTKICVEGTKHKVQSSADMPPVSHHALAACVPLAMRAEACDGLAQVRLGTYINAPPAACVAARAAQEDPRAEPAFGERVPYVVVCGAPSKLYHESEKLWSMCPRIGQLGPGSLRHAYSCCRDAAAARTSDSKHSATNADRCKHTELMQWQSCRALCHSRFACVSCGDTWESRPQSRMRIAGSRLMDVVVAPRVLVEAGGRLRLNAQYYITKQINPAIARVLQLVGADVPAW